MTEIILHLSSGQGPEECRWVVAQLARAYDREAAKAGVDCRLLEPAEGNPASLLLQIDGADAESFANARTGTVLWTGSSPFRPNHRRRNWFVGVTRTQPVEEVADLRDEDIVFQAMRASGPGGQHVNKTDSAVRGVHIPTGLVATSQEQRSQHANRKLVRLKLAMLLEEQRSDRDREMDRAAWDRNHWLERGNPVRTYAGPDFRLRSNGTR